MKYCTKFTYFAVQNCMKLTKCLIYKNFTV